MDKLAILDNIKKLVNDKYGIIDELISIPGISNMPNIYRYIAHRNDIYNSEEFQENDNFGYGYNFLEQDAKISALGEAIERYCASYIPKDLIISNYVAISNTHNVINPNKFITKKNIYQEIPNTKEIAWVRGKSFIDNSDVFIPASAVYLPLPKGNDYFPKLRQEDSTGLATGYTLESANTNAILECIERDAFSITWFNNSKGKLVDINDLDCRNSNRIMKFIELGFEIIIKDITSDIEIPTYMAIIKNYKFTKLPRRYLCIKSGMDMNNTISKLFGELIGGYYSLYEMIHKYDYKPPISLKSIKNIEDHALYYAYNDNDLDEIMKPFEDKKIDKLINYNLEINDSKLDFITNKLKNKKINAYFVDITTSDIKSLGLRVVRVLSDEFCNIESNFESYFHKRIDSGVNQSNLYEHPFS